MANNWSSGGGCGLPKVTKDALLHSPDCSLPLFVFPASQLEITTFIWRLTSGMRKFVELLQSEQTFGLASKRLNGVIGWCLLEYFSQQCNCLRRNTSLFLDSRLVFERALIQIWTEIVKEKSVCRRVRQHQPNIHRRIDPCLIPISYINTRMNTQVNKK